jgi:hypothetical protein
MDASRLSNGTTTPHEEGLMARGCRRLFALALLTFPACTHQWGLTAADRMAIRRLIERRLEALRHGDAVAAFVYDRPEIQAKYRTPWGVENRWTLADTRAVGASKGKRKGRPAVPSASCVDRSSR